jgi:hypothetical protein
VSADDIKRSTIRSIIEDHREAGTVPLAELVALVQTKAPEPPKDADTMKFTVRLYDWYERRWIDCKRGVSWDEAVAEWKKETDDGLKMACYGDGDYYNIFPADTRMIANDLAD